MDSTKNQIENVRLSYNTIGQGAYGVVHKGYISDEVECAVKITHPLLVEASLKYKGLLKEMVLHEADVMNKLPNHPNLVQFMGLYYPPSNRDNFPPYIVMELCHKGNLQSCLKDDTLDIQTKFNILHDIAKGLEHLHSYDYIHCDLTPNNILLTKNLRAKIGDLGATRYFEGKNLIDPAPGRPEYMAPEARGSVCSYNKKLDIYSFGCIVLFTVTEKECTDNIGEWLEGISSWPLLQDLTKKCLQDDPQKRPTAGEICEQLRSMQSNFDAKLKDDSTSLKKFHLNIVQEDHSVVTDFLFSLALDLCSLNETVVTKHINRSYAESFLYTQPHGVTKFEPTCNTSTVLVKDVRIDLDIGTICTASPKIMIPGKQLVNVSQSQHKQVVFTGNVNESVAENTNGIYSSNVSFTKSSVLAKPCTIMTNDEIDIAAAILSLFMCCLLYSLEPFLYVQSFNDTSSKQKCKIMRPHILEQDGRPPEVQDGLSPEIRIACTETDTLPTSSETCYKKQVAYEHDKGNNDRRMPVENDWRLSFGIESLKSNTIQVRPNAGMKYLPLSISGVVTFLLIIFCLQNSFLRINYLSFNGLLINNSKYISSEVVLCQLKINYPSVVAQNNTHAKPNLYVIDESPTSALPLFYQKKQVSNPQCEVQYYSTNKTLLYNLVICDNAYDSFSNYSTRLSDKEKDMEHLHLERYATPNLFVQYPFLCTHHTHQFVNGSENNARDPLVVVAEQDDVSSSILQLPFTNGVVYNHLSYLHLSKQYMKNLHWKWQDQNTNVTLSFNSFIGDDSTVNVGSSDVGKGFPFRKIVENVQSVILYTEPPLVTLPVTLLDHSFMHNQTLFTGDDCTGMLSKTKVLMTALSVTGISEFKGEQCFSKALADGCTVQSLQNNDTCYQLSYGELDNYTFVVKNFHILLDAILSVPLNVISMVSLPSHIDKLIPLHINNNAVVNAVIIIKFLNTHLPYIKSKFKSMTLQYWLQNIFAFLTLCIYISVEWLVTTALTLKSIKQKLQLQIQCCTSHLNKSIQEFICGNNIYYLKNPINFCSMNQHVSTCSLCKQQQVVTIDLTKHRHFSDIWCIICQENLFGSCNMFIFRGMLHNKSMNEILFYDICCLYYCMSDIVYVELIAVSFVLVKHIFCTQESLVLVKVHTCISLPIAIISTELKSYMVFCGNSTPSPEVLPLTSHSGMALGDSQVKNKPGGTTKLLDDAFYTRPKYCFENQLCYLNVKKTRPRMVYYSNLYLIQTVYIMLDLQKIMYQIIQPINKVANEVTQTMNIVNIIHNNKDQDGNCTTYSHNTRQDDNCADNDYTDDGNESDDDYDGDHDDDHDDDHNDNQNKDNHDGDHDNCSGNQNNDNDRNDNDDNGGNNCDHDDFDNDHDDNDDDNDHDHNHNDDDHHDDHNDSDDDNRASNDHDHNEDDDNDRDDNDDENDHGHNDTEFGYCSLLLLLSFLRHLFLVSYHFFVRQIVIICQFCYIRRLSNGCTRVACIGNKSYHNTFRPSSQLTLVQALNTSAVIQRHPYYFRSRYSQYTILRNKLLTNFAFQASPLHFYETASFQTLWFVNMITYELQFNYHSLLHYEGNVPIMLLNSDEQFHMTFLSIQRAQSFVFLLCQQFPSRFHKTSVLILCEVEYEFNIIAIRFQNVNSTNNFVSKISWLKWINHYSLWNCNDAIILDTQLHRPAFLTCEMQVIKVQSPMRHNLWNIAINSKQTKSNIWLMISFKYVCEGERIGTLVTVKVLQSNAKLAYDLYQHALYIQQKGDSMLHSFSNNHDDVHLMEIQFRILINRLEIHLYANTYHFLREIIHEDLSHNINFLGALLQKVTAEGDTTCSILQVLIRCAITYCQQRLLDSPDDRAGVVEMVFEGLTESMKDGSGIQLVTRHINYNICIHQLAQRKCILESVPAHGGDVLIKGNHVLWFLSVNPPLHHPAMLPLPQADSCNQDMKVS